MTDQKEGRILYRKIRYANGRVILEWIEKIEDQVRYGSIDDFNEPMDEFKKSLNILSTDCIDLCELIDNDGELQKRIEVSTVNIKYETEKETPGINISFKINRMKKSGAYSITTPYQLLKSKDEDDFIDDDLVEKIKKLIEEADNYRTGKRKQIEIEFKSDNIQDDSAFIVKLNGELNGLLKPGVLLSLTRLANNAMICRQNGKAGIYNINPPDKENKKQNKNVDHIFTLKRNGDVLILISILNKNIEEYEKDNLNSFVLDILNDKFKNHLID